MGPVWDGIEELFISEAVTGVLVDDGVRVVWHGIEGWLLKDVG